MVLCKLQEGEGFVRKDKRERVVFYTPGGLGRKDKREGVVFYEIPLDRKD